MIIDELNPRKGKGIPASGPVSRLTKQAISRIVNRVPEVMLKVSASEQKDKDGNIINHPSPRNMKALAGLVDYIGKDNDLIDETGFHFSGPDATKEALRGWSGIPATGGTKREVLHIVLSMPAGSDRMAVQRAVVSFASKQFENHQYLIGHHDDTDRPHSHIALKIEDMNGKRINPRKADLQQWRESFASELRELNVEASATSRVSRLSTRQRIQQSRYRYHKDKSTDAELDKLLNPELEMRDIHHRVVAEYKEIYDELKAGPPEDQELAVKLNEYVKQQTGRLMPEPAREAGREPER